LAESPPRRRRDCFDIPGCDPSVWSGLKSGRSPFPDYQDVSTPALGPAISATRARTLTSKTQANGPLNAVWKLLPSSLVSLRRKKKEHSVVKHVSKLALAEVECLKETVQRR